MDITPDEMYNYLEDCNNTSSRQDSHKTFLDMFYAMYRGDFLDFAVVPGSPPEPIDSLLTGGPSASMR